MEEKNKTYTAADFARYHAGTMPPGEMHALEKAALEDPFLEDALEGYTHSSAVKSDIEELKRRLAEKRKKKDLFFISSFAQNKWWRIAALFIILVGSGYFFYRLNFVNKENSLAENKIESSSEKTDSTAALKAEIATTSTDSITKNNDIAFENPRAPKVTQKRKATLLQAKPGIYKDAVAPAKKAETEIVHNNYASTLRDSLYHISASDKEVSKSDSQAVNEYVLKGKVTDDIGYPVPFANITSKALSKGTIADAEGRFLLRSRDSTITASASATGFETKTFLLKKDTQSTIAMNRMDAELTSVVVTTPLAKHKQLKEQASLSKSLDEKTGGVQIITAGPRPSGGQEKFDQYLQENTSPIYDENNARVTGQVLLSFTVNKKGRPKNIKVVKSSCEACEKKAIKLLEDGPDWVGGKDKPGTVVIKF